MCEAADSSKKASTTGNVVSYISGNIIDEEKTRSVSLCKAKATP